MIPVSRSLLALACALIALLLVAGPAAAAPANDNFASAETLTAGVTTPGSTVDSTEEAGETFNPPNLGTYNTVWYTYMPAKNGLITLTLCSDKGMNVFAGYGALNSLALASTSPDSYGQKYWDPTGCNGTQYALTIGPFRAIGGQPLMIQFGSSYAGSTEEGATSIRLDYVAAPDNDNFAAPGTLTTGNTTTGTTVAATEELNERFIPPNYGTFNSVWYQYTPESDGLLSLHACSDTGMNLIAGTGSLGALLPASQNPDSFGQKYWDPTGCNGSQYEQVVGPFPVTGGQPLIIQFANSSLGIGQQGAFSIRPELIPEPANDDLATAAVLADNVLTDGTTVGATIQSGEDFSTNGWGLFNSVWYRYTVPSTGVFALEVCAQKGVNVVTALDGSFPLSAVASGNPTYAQDQRYWGPIDCGYPVVMSMPVTAGQELRVHVGSAYIGLTQQGTFKIIGGMRPSPANDSFTGSVDLGAQPSVDQAGHNFNAPDNTNEPQILAGSRPNMVWYKWTSPSDGSTTFDTCDTWGDSVIGVFNSVEEDPTLAQLDPVIEGAAGCGSGSDGAKVSIPTEAGRAYWIAVASQTANSFDEARFTLKIRRVPGNDNWADATDLDNAETVSVASDNVNATADTPNPQISGQFPRGSVWYKWTAPRTATVVIDACDGASSSYDGYLAVFATDDPTPSESNVAQVGADDDACLAPRTLMPSLELSATSGKTYWIVFSQEPSEGVDSFSDFTLKISSPPYNTALPDIGGDDYFTGTVLTAAPGSWGGTPTITYDYQWQRCDENGEYCTDIPGADQSTYTPVSPEDVGSTLQVTVVASNGVDNAQAASLVSPIIDVDSDGDGVGDADDECDSNAQESPKTNGCPIEQITIDTDPSLSGAARLGSTITLDVGAASNDGIDLSVAAPTRTINWWSCSHPTNSGTCAARAGSGTTYVVQESDVARYIRAEVVWENSDTDPDNDPAFKMSVALGPVIGDLDRDGVLDDVDACPSTAAGQDGQPNGCPRAAAPTTPVAPTPLDLSTLVLPKQVTAKKLVKSKGKFTLTADRITCPAGGADCAIKFDLTAKIKKKTKKLGSNKLTIPAGSTMPLKGKLSKSGLKLVKKAKKLKADMAITGTGGVQGKKTYVGHVTLMK